MAPRLPVLEAGGAGYIGSHVVRLLRAAGYPVVAYDDLLTGFPWAVLEEAELIVGGLADRTQLAALIAERRFGAVLHFAASVRIDDPRRDPAKCYRNHVAHALGLFELAVRSGVSRLVFSSTAAVCGEPETLPIDEATPPAPISPCGASKMMAERALPGVAASSGVRIHGRTARPPTTPASSTTSMWTTSSRRISMLSNTSRAPRARSCSTAVMVAATACAR